MSKLSLAVAAVAVLSIGIGPHVAHSQPPSKRDLQTGIQNLQELDPDIEKFLPRWRILEADLKIKLAQYFKISGIPVSEQDSMIVTATFPKPNTNEQDLLSLRVGDSQAAVLSGAAKIRQEIGELLYQELLNRDYEHQIIEPATPVTESSRERMPTVMLPTTAKQFVALSAFNQILQVGSTGARLVHSLGNDEIGYHFWQSGQGKVTLHYSIIPLSDPQLRARGVPDIFMVDLGVAYRMKFGTGDDLLDGVISPRRLNGAIGPKAIAKLEYRLPQVNDLGFQLSGEIPFNKLAAGESVTADNSVVWFSEPDERVRRQTEDDTIRAAYFLRTVAQGSIFWENFLNEYEHFFRISLGVSYQEISRTAITIAEETGDAILKPNDLRLGSGVQYRQLFHPTEFEDWLYAKVDYLNQSGFPFGVSAQLANRNLLISGYIPVLRNWLFLEAKYSTPVLRDEPMPWEYKSFFMISPVLRFQLD